MARKQKNIDVDIKSFESFRFWSDASGRVLVMCLYVLLGLYKSIHTDTHTLHVKENALCT